MLRVLRTTKSLNFKNAPRSAGAARAPGNAKILWVLWIIRNVEKKIGGCKEVNPPPPKNLIRILYRFSVFLGGSVCRVGGGG